MAAPVAGFVLGPLLARGTHGNVYLATHEASGMTVALKTVRFAAVDAARRFGAEVAAASRLVHPGIVRVLAAGHARDTGWIAMEPLAGCDLLRYTRAARRLPEPAALEVAARVARALAHAHARGIVHRDVKPSNVMVDWASGRVVLTDFGLARAAETERTGTGVVAGTPGYMAPEALAGADATPAADVYGLGATLFELLASRRPHEAASLGALLQAVAQTPAPHLRGLVPGLGDDVAGDVAAALAARAEDRPTAAEFAARLEAACARLGGGPMSRP